MKERGYDPGSWGVDDICLAVSEASWDPVNSMRQCVFKDVWSPIPSTNTLKQGGESEPIVGMVSTCDGGDMPPTPMGIMCCPIVPHQVTFCEDDTVQYIEPSKEFNNHMYDIMWAAMDRNGTHVGTKGPMQASLMRNDN